MIYHLIKVTFYKLLKRMMTLIGGMQKIEKVVKKGTSLVSMLRSCIQLKLNRE